MLVRSKDNEFVISEAKTRDWRDDCHSQMKIENTKLRSAFDIFKSEKKYNFLYPTLIKTDNENVDEDIHAI